jgi:hypothetical protein
LLVNHKPGERFPTSEFTIDEVRDFLRMVASSETVFMYKRVLYRIDDCGLNPLEVIKGVEAGEPVDWEVTPDRWDIRLEVRPPHGDAASFFIVVYVTRDHGLFCEDVREAP